MCTVFALSSYEIVEGGDISGTLTLPAGVTAGYLDWIGVFTVDSDVSCYWWYVYVPTGASSLAFTTSGEWSATTVDGPYEMRYYTENGTTPLYYSAEVNVTQSKCALVSTVK